MAVRLELDADDRHHGVDHEQMNSTMLIIIVVAGEKGAMGPWRSSHVAGALGVAAKENKT